MSWEVKLSKDKQENKKHTFLRWEDERLKVCQEKEFQKCITKKEVFYKIYPIREALKLRTSQKHYFTLWIK